MMRIILIMIVPQMQILKYLKIPIEKTDLQDDELLLKMLMNKDFDILIKEKEKKEIKEENEDSIEEESITKKIPQKDLKVKVEPILL